MMTPSPTETTLHNAMTASHRAALASGDKNDLKLAQEAHRGFLGYHGLIPGSVVWLSEYRN